MYSHSYVRVTTYRAISFFNLSLYKIPNNYV